MRLRIPALFLILVLGGCVAPRHVYLTWQGDPATTMTVNFQTSPTRGTAQVHYDTLSRSDAESYAFTLDAASEPFGEGDGQREVHHVELTGLDPGATYYFRTETEEFGRSREYKFRTVPNDGSLVRFVVGGDMGILPNAPRLQAAAAELSPMFVVIGGDLAYANGDLKNAWIWDTWLRNWETKMVTPEGYLVPMVLGIGNHEVNDLEGPPEVRAPFYFGFFPQGGKTCFTRQFGPNVLMILLDSGHILPHGPDQAQWLEDTLQAHEQVPFTFAAYHVPLYPSHRSFDDPRSVAGREWWEPLFLKYGLAAGFEHHDHTHKRTKPMALGVPSAEGIPYFGDGAMGVPVRSIENMDLGYLETASSTPHFWLVEVSEDGARLNAFNVDGAIFDSAVLTAE
ncbi:MAG: metallophosphoesterase family protein [Candidatus Hydrogenedentes bacterium]|nr:metallophosphoesterase family protein [Candidatus Hydrogenedentota bacterium]